MIIKIEIFIRTDVDDITKNPRFQARMKGTMIGMFLGGPNMAIVQEHDWKKQRKVIAVSKNK